MSDNARQALRPIVARDQVRLGPGRGLRLALSGMAYRMFRSSVTIAILALATAFLVHMLSYGLLQRATERQAFDELNRQRRMGQMMTRLSDADLDSTILDALASRQSAPVAEYGLWSGLGASATADAVTIARRLHDAALAFGDYPAAARAVLLGDASAQDFLLDLRVAEVAHLDMQMRQLGVRAPLGSIGALRQLVVDELPRLRQFIAAAQQGQRRAIDSITQSLAGQPLVEALQKPAPDLTQRLRAAGYELTSGDLVELSRLQARTSDLAKVNQALQNGEVATEIGRMASLEDAKVNFESLSAYVTQLSRAKAIRQRLMHGGMPETITADRLLELARSHVRESQLARALGGQTAALETTRFGLSERNQWLAVLSFLVCIVGVANAMLMSVTERFTEIATMKCLGAMDGFVMMMFVFEATIQGVAGGVVGLLVGFALAVLRASVEYGSLLASATGVAVPVLAAMAVSLAVSVALAAMAAVGPAWLAARLSPMEAMRVE